MPLYTFDMYLVISASENVLLPNRWTVAEAPQPIFPAVRADDNYAPLTVSPHGWMYDDNTTPLWALLWAHGYSEVENLSGWSIAHIWEFTDDASCYTRLANLVLIPDELKFLKPMSQLLVDFLRWHVWTVYEWKPDAAEIPSKPKDYDEVQWKYLPHHPSPMSMIKSELLNAYDERARILRALMPES